MAIGVSVIICCYNSSGRLSETLRHLALQDVGKDIPWEIIIVDNASTDGSASVADVEWKKYHLEGVGFKIVSEPRAGLTNARMTGIKNALFDLVIFCDDDNWLDKDYIAKAFEIMKHDPAIGILGGRIDAVSDQELPFWFTTYQNSYAVGAQGIVSGDISDRKYVWGAGMVLRKNVLLKLIGSGFNFFLSDRSGKQLMSGGDAELCAWHLLVGMKLWYSEDLHLKHFMPVERLSKEYVSKIIAGHHESNKILGNYYFILRSLKEMNGGKRISLFRLKVNHFRSKIVKREISFQMLSTLQMLYPKKTYDQFTKDVIKARSNYLG